MANLLNTLIVAVSLILLVNCDDFKCPSYGSKGGKKVPNVLELVAGQNGYFSTVEVNNKYRENLVHEYYNDDRKLGFVDLEAMIQTEMNRRYYYHETNEKIAIRKKKCTRLDLNQDEKVESIKDWFEPANIVSTSEIFRDFIHFGPSVLMLYAASISSKASYIGTETIDGRSIDHWFYCVKDFGPYIDVYFDAVTSYPYRFSLFYPSMNETGQTEEGRHSDYVYNFFTYKPLTISQHEPLPYPLGYGCIQKDSPFTVDLPEFTLIPKFKLDLEAIITYPSGDTIKTTARVMKYDDVYSYEITEGSSWIRSIENPAPLGRYEIERNGSCKYHRSTYDPMDTIDTRWPYFTDRDFNLLAYIVMKPNGFLLPSLIGTIDLGPVRVLEYRANRFFDQAADAIVDYYYPVLNNSIDPNDVPSKIIYTRDHLSNPYFNSPDTVEVTIIDFQTTHFSVEDRFDISGCFENFGQYSWFQIVFSNPFLSKELYRPAVREDVHDFLTKFIPITRISDIIIDDIDSNIYVTVKLLDRIHFIEAYQVSGNKKLVNADRVIKHWQVENCEEACTTNRACTEFSYCSDFTCALKTFSYSVSDINWDDNCTTYSLDSQNLADTYVKKNFLSSIRNVLHQIRRKIDDGDLYLVAIGSNAEEMFIVTGPEEIGDLSENEVEKHGGKHLRGDEYPVVKSSRKFSAGIAIKTNIEYLSCLRLCSNDDQCNSVSYCPDQNEECILSIETELTLNSSMTTTVQADGCNIYEKSAISYFQKYPGKSLVVDSVETKEGIQFADCARECINAKDFNCQSFDYCSPNHELNDSVCFLHVHHITADVDHQVNVSNWKSASAGCDHFSKKADHDYRQIVAHIFNPTATPIIDTYNEIPVEDCAHHCNSHPDECYSFEYCEMIEELNLEEPEANYDQAWYFLPKSRWVKSTCRLSSIRPSSTSNTNDPEFRKYFDLSKDDKICSIYINQEKNRQSKSTEKLLPSNRLPHSTKDRTSLAFGLGISVFVLAFIISSIGFTCAVKKKLINVY